jgi:hypothetical protein
LLIVSGLHKFAAGSMKAVSHILKSQLFIAIVFGFLGSAMLVQQVSAIELQVTATEEAPADDQGNDEETASLNVSQVAINSVVGVHLTQEFHQIMEIRFESKNDPEIENEAALFDSGHNRTLFRQVISPNAP